MNNASELTEIINYYNAGVEKERLQKGIGKIEFERTKEIIARYLSKDRLVIYDIGGGVGIYSRWLAEMGHQVHMFELSPKAVDYATELQKTLDYPIYKIEEVDARNIKRPDESADIVLLMGPLYHLTDREERIKALAEATRVLKKDGVMLIAAISRFGSTLWGLSVFGKSNNYIAEGDFLNMIARELMDGQHIRPERYPYFIARSFFHTPNELAYEINEVGLNHEKTLPVEGPAWIVPALEDKWSDSHSKEILLKIIDMVEDQETLLGMSPHMIAIARKSGGVDYPIP